MADHKWFDPRLAEINREREKLMRWFLRIVWAYLAIEGALLLVLLGLGVYALFKP